MLWERLTKRQAEIAELLCGGMSDMAIAKRLGIERRTVKNVLGRIYSNLGITDLRRHSRITLVTNLLYDLNPEVLSEQPDLYSELSGRVD